MNGCIINKCYANMYSYGSTSHSSVYNNNEIVMKDIMIDIQTSTHLFVCVSLYEFIIVCIYKKKYILQEHILKILKGAILYYFLTIRAILYWYKDVFDVLKKKHFWFWNIEYKTFKTPILFFVLR